MLSDRVQSSPIKSLSYFVKSLIDASKNKVAAIKFQSAFFETLGADGFCVLKEMVTYAKKSDLLVILDAKRSDIGTTMKAYLSASFDRLGVDALTIVPFFGQEQLEVCLPFIERGAGIYAVVLPSNPGGFERNRAHLNSNLAALSKFKVDSQSAFGVVAGATSLSQLERWEVEALKDYSLLMPGLGAQGGKPQALRDIHLPRQEDLLPISRGLLNFSTKPHKRKQFESAVADKIACWSPALAPVSI